MLVAICTPSKWTKMALAQRQYSPLSTSSGRIAPWARKSVGRAGDGPPCRLWKTAAQASRITTRPARPWPATSLACCTGFGGGGRSTIPSGNSSRSRASARRKSRPSTSTVTRSLLSLRVRESIPIEPSRAVISPTRRASILLTTSSSMGRAWRLSRYFVAGVGEARCRIPRRNARPGCAVRRRRRRSLPPIRRALFLPRFRPLGLSACPAR